MLVSVIKITAFLYSKCVFLSATEEHLKRAHRSFSGTGGQEDPTAAPSPVRPEQQRQNSRRDETEPVCAQNGIFRGAHRCGCTTGAGRTTTKHKAWFCAHVCQQFGELFPSPDLVCLSVLSGFLSALRGTGPGSGCAAHQGTALRRASPNSPQ